MKGIFLFIISCFICMTCAAQQTFNLDMVSHTKIQDSEFIGVNDQTEANDAYRVSFKIGTQYLTVSVSLIRINRSGTVSTLKQLEKHTIKIANFSTSKYTKDGKDIINILDDSSQLNIHIFLNDHFIRINDDVYGLNFFYDGHYFDLLYEDSYDKPQWKTRTTKYHNDVYEKLKVALSEFSDKGNGKSGGNSCVKSTNSTKISAPTRSDILKLFFNPLGIDNLINLNALQIKNYLDDNGYNYEQRECHEYGNKSYYSIDFIIQDSDFENVFGVRLPLCISYFDGRNGNKKGVQISYSGANFQNPTEMENDKANSLLNGDAIAIAFEKAGYINIGSEYSDFFGVYNLQDYKIEIYRAADKHLVVLMY